jgi:V8-like Glu-specific endopeptidase
MNFKWAGLACALVSIAACTGSQNKSIDTTTTQANPDDSKVSERVIYGVDNRIDVYQESDQSWKDLAASTVAIMDDSSLKITGTNYTVSGSSLGASQGVCKTEPFYEQQTAAFCSGSLIAPDIIMSAGHCVRTQSACEGIKFVFNYAYRAKGVAPTTVSQDDVYSCKELIHSELNSTTSSDFSLVRLDRKVIGHAPLTVRQKDQVTVGNDLTVIGHPSRLPTKISDGAKVRDTTAKTFFVANLDTYGGNSGSAVFNSSTGVVEGILVRGATDYVYKNGCYVSNVCPADGCRGEDVTRVSEIFNYLDKSELVQPVVAAPVVEEPVDTATSATL